MSFQTAVSGAVRCMGWCGGYVARSDQQARRGGVDTTAAGGALMNAYVHHERLTAP